MKVIQKKTLTLGEFISSVYDTCGQQRPRDCQFAVNSPWFIFEDSDAS
jgi:hypothetical protein